MLGRALMVDGGFVRRWWRDGRIDQESPER